MSASIPAIFAPYFAAPNNRPSIGVVRTVGDSERPVRQPHDLTDMARPGLYIKWQVKFYFSHQTRQMMVILIDPETGYILQEAPLIAVYNTLKFTDLMLGLLIDQVA